MARSLPARRRHRCDLGPAVAGLEAAFNVKLKTTKVAGIPVSTGTGIKFGYAVMRLADGFVELQTLTDRAADGRHVAHHCQSRHRRSRVLVVSLDPTAFRRAVRLTPPPGGRPRSAHGTASCCSPRSAFRARGATVRASISRSPRTSMYGTFCSCARRILFCIRLSDVSTSTRRPRARRTPASSCAGLDVAVGDRDDDGLDRGEPERERAREVLDQDADEPLERAVDRAVDGDRPLRLAVLVDVGQVEPLGQHHQVDLDGRHLPLAPECVVDVDVDLRARRTCRPWASGRS